MASRSGWIAAFAPASIANFGSGFDVFGAAIAAVAAGKGKGRLVPLGDLVRVRRTRARGVRVVEVTGDAGRLPRAASRNCASVAAAGLLRRARAGFGLDLVVEKGLPLSSGLGSSAASAAAGVYAAMLALDGEISPDDLLLPALEGEHAADGSWHGDNVWSSLLGGGLLVVSTRPAEVVPLGTPRGLRLVLVHPDCELATREARAALPASIPVADATAQAGRLGSLVAAWRRGDRRSIGLALVDRIAEPARAPLVPGYAEAKREATKAGALGVTFSGAGPTVLAVAPEGEEEKVAAAICRGFDRAGLGSEAFVAAVDPRGARPVGDEEER